MKKFFIPTEGPEDWRRLLADPDKQWKPSYSAYELAYCWQKANDFPDSVKKVFKKSRIDLFQKAELLFAFPEYKVPLPGGVRPSQNDIFILAKGNNQLISITIEGKIKEGFDKAIDEWLKKDRSEGKEKKLKFLLNKLQLIEEQVKHIRYQLLHRTASAIIEAEKFGAKNALMLVHSFSTTDEGFRDYSNFVALFERKAKPDSLVFAKKINGINLYFSWVKAKPEWIRKKIFR